MVTVKKAGSAQQAQSGKMITLATVRKPKSAQLSQQQLQLAQQVIGSPILCSQNASFAQRGISVITQQLSGTILQIIFVLLAIGAPQELRPWRLTHALLEHIIPTQVLRTQMPAFPHHLGSTNPSKLQLPLTPRKLAMPATSARWDLALSAHFLWLEILSSKRLDSNTKW